MTGDYYELGAREVFFGQLWLDTNMFRRDVNIYADDDQTLNTGISFPIAFHKAVIYSAEGKLEVLDCHRFSGFLSCLPPTASAAPGIAGAEIAITSRTRGYAIKIA